MPETTSAPELAAPDTTSAPELAAPDTTSAPELAAPETTSAPEPPAPAAPEALAGDPILAALPSTAPEAEQVARLPRGFRALGATIGIKASGKPDLLVVATDGAPAAAAGVFTRNAFAAAPVRLTKAHLAETAPDGNGGFGWAGAVIGTSGSANAATGAPGDADQAHIAHALADALSILPSHVLALSTGVIGVRLPAALIAGAIGARVPGDLAATDEAFAAAGRSILTTDSRAKSATVRVTLPAPDGSPVEVTVSGVAKGVGMIHPGMATMLALLLTDAAVDPATLHRLLRPVAAHTWNQLTVDGDTSTNDTVLVLASGASGAAPVVPGETATVLGAALHGVARSLARQQAADGEGATTLITCQVSGAADAADGRAVARSVVASSLFKAAVHGRDPNWGRIAGAAGNARLPDAAVLEAAGLPRDAAAARAGSPAAVAPALLRIAIAGHLVYAGQPIAFDKAAASAAMNAPEVLVRLDLGLGDGAGEAFGCDLTEEYVRENSEYTT